MGRKKPKKAQENYQRDRVKQWRKQDALKVTQRASTLGEEMMIPGLIAGYVRMKTNTHKWARTPAVLSEREKRALLALYNRAKRHQEPIIFDNPSPCLR